MEENKTNKSLGAKTTAQKKETNPHEQNLTEYAKNGTLDKLKAIYDHNSIPESLSLALFEIAFRNDKPNIMKYLFYKFPGLVGSELSFYDAATSMIRDYPENSESSQTQKKIEITGQE